MDTLYFSWLESPVDIDVGLRLPHFNLEEAILYDCSQNYTAGQWGPHTVGPVMKRNSNDTSVTYSRQGRINVKKFTTIFTQNFRLWYVHQKG